MSTCRAVFNKTETLITNKRTILDNSLKEIAGIKFIISCVTGTASHNAQDGTFTPGIAYFICFGPNTTESVIHQCFHDQDLEFDLKTIKFRRGGNDKDLYMRQLKQIVKVLLFILTIFRFFLGAFVYSGNKKIVSPFSPTTFYYYFSGL